MPKQRRRKVQRGARRKGKRGARRKVQRGGASPFFVDFKKGINVTKNMVKAVKNTDFDKAKKQYARDQKKWKKSNSSKSFGDWAIETGRAKRAGCCLM